MGPPAHAQPQQHRPTGVCGIGRAAATSRCPIIYLITIFLHAAVAAAGNVHHLAKVSFEPAHIHGLLEENNETLTLNVEFDPDAMARENVSNACLFMKTLHPSIATIDPPLACFVPSTVPSSFKTNNNESSVFKFQSMATISGKFIGKTALDVRLVSVADQDSAEDFIEQETSRELEFGTLILPSTDKTMSRMDVWVIREDYDIATKLFVILLILLISIANVLMGCELDLKLVFETVKKPIAPLIGFCTQFLVMPILAYMISQLVLVPRGLYSFALGLFVTACAPGGGASNFWTLLLDGNVNLSVTMTFFSTVASIGMIPLWMNFVGYQFLQGFNETHVTVPYNNIVRGLIILIAPLLIGVGIARVRPALAARARRVLRPFIIFVLIFVITFGTLSNLYMFRLMTPAALISGLLLPWCGFMCGCFTSLLLGQKPENVTAIAIETGVQNTGIAIMLLKFSFQQPDADISSLIPVIVACFTPGPLLLGYGVHMLIKFLRGRSGGSSVDVEKEASVAYNNTSTTTSPKKVQTGLHEEFSRCPLMRHTPPSESSSSDEGESHMVHGITGPGAMLGSSADNSAATLNSDSSGSDSEGITLPLPPGGVAH